MIIIKGNPKHKIKESTLFYKTLENIGKEKGFDVSFYESDIQFTDIKNYRTLGKNDVVIGFSRGCTYAKPAYLKLKIKTNFIGIGCSKNKWQQEYLLNPEDKTTSGDMSYNSLKAHWTLTKSMQYKLSHILNKIKKDKTFDKELIHDLMVKKSGIAGKGVFSKVPLKKNTELGLAFRGRSPQSMKRTDLGAFTNHSNQPNVKFIKKDDEYHFVLLKDIQKNEELFIDYNKFDWEGKRDFAKPVKK